MVELSNLGLDEVGSNPTYHILYKILSFPFYPFCTLHPTYLLYPPTNYKHLSHHSIPIIPSNLPTLTNLNIYVKLQL